MDKEKLRKQLAANRLELLYLLRGVDYANTLTTRYVRDGIYWMDYMQAGMN